MNYAAYIAGVRERLGALGFTELTPQPDLTERFALTLEREERWGRLVIALVSKLNMTDGAEREAAVAAAGAWTRALRRGETGAHMILVFPFDRKVKEEESEAILKLRQEGSDRRWSLVPWTADLEVELLDRHTGFPPVPPEVARALTEVPRGRVEEIVRRSSGPRVGRPRLLGSLSHLPATRIILALTISYYLWTLLMSGIGSSFGAMGGLFGGLLGGPDTRTLLNWGANNGLLVFAHGQQWRLLSYMLLHGSIWHLGLNMWALWRLGQHVEMVYGTGRMLFIYLVAGVAGGIGSTAFRGDFVTSVGASGAVMGLLGALIYFGHSFRERPVNWQGLWSPVIFTLLYGFFMPFIDNHAHIGGLLGGLLAGFLAGVPGERKPWRSAAMATLAIGLALVVFGVIPLPHFIPRL